MLHVSRGNVILDMIYDEVHHLLNPSDDECWYCGGEGATFDCIDGCCEAAESGCEDCARPCQECAIYEASVKRHVTLAVLRDMNIEVARAFAQRTNKSARASAMTDQQILANLHAGRVARKEFTDQERADSACWVECLL